MTLMITLVERLVNEIVDFFEMHGLVDMVRTGDYHTLRTLAGIDKVLAPLIPILLVLEVINAFILKKFSAAQYRVPLLTFVFNRLMRHFFTILLVTWTFGMLAPLSPIKTTITWYWLIYCYIVWELGMYTYHYFGHKVRLLWCLHSAHHTPEHMNLSVSYSHFFLEAPYADIVRTAVAALLGVNFPFLIFIMFVDTWWGGFIHVGEGLMRKGKLGFLYRVILTPNHHRLHHARNPLYMDTNFCNLLNIWDRIFGTYREERDNIEVVYGTTRCTSGKWWDAYFGEFVALGKDVYHAPGLRNKLLYIVMPPGWSHTGDHKTAGIVRRQWLQENAIIQQPETLRLELEVRTDSQPQAGDVGMLQVSKAFYKIEPENGENIVDPDAPLYVRPTGKRIR